jgi:predicted unusual protein kinase regulating ubiquinone biosynthesis (AarF/ABC1/UbiB family)
VQAYGSKKAGELTHKVQKLMEPLDLQHKHLLLRLSMIPSQRTCCRQDPSTQIPAAWKPRCEKQVERSKGPEEIWRALSQNGKLTSNIEKLACRLRIL